MKAWHITDWEKYYEVNDSDRPFKPGEKRRKTPLPYVRWYVGGPDNDNQAYQECALRVVAEHSAEGWMMAFGLFGKLLELAAGQQQDLRGYILGKGGKPVSIEFLSYLTLFPQEHIRKGLEILSSPSVQWIEEVEMPNSATVRETPRDSATDRGAPLSLQEPKPNRTEPKENINLNRTEPKESHSGKVLSPVSAPKPDSPAIAPPDGNGSKQLGKATTASRPVAPSRDFQLGQIEEARHSTEIAQALRLSPQGPTRDSPTYQQWEADMKAIAGIGAKCRSWLSLDDVLTKARSIADSPNVKNRIACLVAWVKVQERKELAK